MNFGKFSLGFASVITLVMAFGASAQAQMMQWGSGQWGGQQQCPYQASMGKGSMSQDDGLSVIANDIKQAQKDLQAKQAAQKKADKEVSRAEQDINDALEADHADFIIQHLSNRFACDEYDIPQAAPQEPEMATGGNEGGKEIRRADKKKMSTKPFSKNDWAQYCTDTGVATSVCDNAAYRQEGGTRFAADKCKKGISAYKKSYNQSQKLAAEVDRLKETIESLKEQYADAKETAAEDRKMGLASGGGFSADTEAGGCEECGRMGNGRQSGGGTDWANVISNGVTAVAAIGLGAYMNNKVTESNAELGFPTGNLYPAWGYGLPYAQQAMYGAISGMTGQGSFGCGGNSASAGGAFGYPQSMMMGMNGMNSMSGGMYLGGMSPWGMNGNMGMYGNMGGYGYGNMMGGYGNMMGMGGMMSVGGMMGGYGSMMGAGGLMSLGGISGYGGYGSLMNGGMMMSGYGSLNSGYGSLMGYGSLVSGGMMMSGGYGSLMSGGLNNYAQYYQQEAAKYSQLTSLQSEMQALQYRMQMIQSGYYSGYGSTGSLSSSIGSLNSGIYNYGSVTGTTGLTPIGISSGGTIYQER